MTISTFVDSNGKPTILRDPDSVLDYTIDLTDWLADLQDDTLQSVTTQAVGVTVDGSGIAGPMCYAWVSGGVAGGSGSVTFRFTTAMGRTDDRTIYFRIRER